MKTMFILFSLVIFTSCAHDRRPASIEGHPVAYDSMAWGNIKASATKRVHQQEVCFDIGLEAKDIKPEQAQANNWDLAWVDKNNQYHLIPTNLRSPASTPQGGLVVAPYGSYFEYTGQFTTCIQRAQMSDVKGLVLTPKDLPYSKEGLELNWKE